MHLIWQLLGVEICQVGSACGREPALVSTVNGPLRAAACARCRNGVQHPRTMRQVGLGSRDDVFLSSVVAVLVWLGRLCTTPEFPSMPSLVGVEESIYPEQQTASFFLSPLRDLFIFIVFYLFVFLKK